MPPVYVIGPQGVGECKPRRKPYENARDEDDHACAAHVSENGCKIVPDMVVIMAWT